MVVLSKGVVPSSRMLLARNVVVNLAAQILPQGSAVTAEGTEEHVAYYVSV